MLHEKERIETERYWTSSRVDAANLSHIRKSLSVIISLYHSLSIFVNLKATYYDLGIPWNTFDMLHQELLDATTQPQEWVRLSELRARACSNIHATDEYRVLAGHVSEKPRQQVK